MLQFELLDESFDINKTFSYHLSIQTTMDGLLFAILDASGLKYVGLKRYQFEKTFNPDQQYEEIQKIIDKEPLLQKPYQGVSCIYSEPRSTLLPAALFDRENLKLYFEFNHILNDLDELHYNYLRQMDAYIVFPIYSEMASLLLKTWMNTRFFHPATPLIDAHISREMETGVRAGINFSEDHFDIIISENKNLKYHNNFKYRSDEDLLYFILLVFDKLGLDQEKTPLLLSGEIDKFSERPSHLKRYFNKLSFMQPPAGFKYPPSFHKIQEHSLLSLLRVYHCE